MEGQQQARAQGEQHKQAPAAMLESAELAKKHRQERGEPEPQEVGKSGVGSHYNVGGGIADYGPTDTERINQPDDRNIEARVP